MSNNAELIALVREYERICEQGDEAAIKEFLREYPGIINYDDRGNWIGSVRNENGWTP